MPRGLKRGPLFLVPPQSYIANGTNSDEYCPYCDNHFVIEALIPKPRLEVEGEDVRKDAR